MQKSNSSPGTGKLYLVGIGPGSRDLRTIACENALKESEVIVGYSGYMQYVTDLSAGKKIIESGMRRETERVAAALDEADKGRIVSLISSGDAGVYGMAGLALEMCAQKPRQPEICIIPGVTAANAAAARIGAPLMCDYAIVSLSDLLVSREQILHRLKKIAEADLVCILYNPQSKKRIELIRESQQIFLTARPALTPVAVVRNISLPEESAEISDLGHFLEMEIDMKTVVIIGNSQTKNIAERLVTLRGYKVQ